MGRSGDRRRRMVIDLSSMTTLTTFVHLFQNAPNDGFSVSHLHTPIIQRTFVLGNPLQHALPILHRCFYFADLSYFTRYR
jgi:hypothetical protein